MQVSDTHGVSVTAERLFAYTYGILAQPAYAETFWDELELPPPRLPITRNPSLFARVADLGTKLLRLHTFGERFTETGSGESVPQGSARCTKPVSSAEYPTDADYDEENQVLRVGEGEHAGRFEPVPPEVWEYSVSGMQVVKSWLDRRKAEASGKRSSPLDDIRPEQWEFGEELLELLWVVEHTIALEPEGAMLLEEVRASSLFTADELPKPTEAERKAPQNAPGEQIDLNL